MAFSGRSLNRLRQRWCEKNMGSSCPHGLLFVLALCISLGCSSNMPLNTGPLHMRLLQLELSALSLSV